MFDARTNSVQKHEQKFSVYFPKCSALPSPTPAVTCFRSMLRSPTMWNDKRLLKHLRKSLEPPPSFLPPSRRPSPAHPPWASVLSYNNTEKVIRDLFRGMVVFHESLRLAIYSVYSFIYYVSFTGLLPPLTCGGV